MSKSQKVYLPFKRLIGIVGSIIGIVVMAAFFWWWILIVNTIVTKGHPVFAQERIGKNGQPFKLLKFRSMRIDADPNVTSEESNGDSVTKFGMFLRKTSLDESLQLVNILIGTMAFIGPRPLIYYDEDIITIDLRKESGAICLYPGLGGYAQVHGRINVSASDKAKLDQYYFEHISFWLDIKLFFQTVFGSLSRKDTKKINN